MTFSLGGNPRLRRGLVAVTVACIVFACAAYAQVLYGSLTGSVTDATNSVVAGATVEALNVGTGVAKETSTNSRGVYSFSDLQPGTYNITISSPSFSKVVSENVSIDANRVVRVNATLQIAQVNEAIQVSGSAIALQTDRAEVMTNLTTKQVSDLPLTGSTGRNFQSLMTIVPGAVMQGEQNSAAGNPQRAISFNVNGVSRLQNNTRMDGASITYPWLPTNIAYVPPAEAIETVNVVTNSYTAEQGMAGGAEINVIIKAGTNQLHGSAWDFHTNSHFKTRNYFQTTPQNPKNILNQLGGSIGGPIIKNKLFYFGDIERTTTRNSSPISLTSIAPADLRAGDFSATGTTIYDPTSNSDPTKRTPFAGNKVPASQIDLAAVEMIKRMPQRHQDTWTTSMRAALGRSLGLTQISR